MTDVADLSAYRHRFALVDFAKTGTEYGSDAYAYVTESEANCISSELDDGTERHTLAIDLDVPAKLIPSSTEGHSHLYIDVPMTWEQYTTILDALAAVGIVEDGYVGASKRRGFTSLRLPHVSKTGETPYV